MDIDTPLTRRQTLVRAGGAAGALIGGGSLLAACGSSGSSTTKTKAAAPGGKVTGGSVGFFTYALYSDPKLTGAFTHDTGTAVKPDSYAELNEMLSKLRATRGKGFDCISVASNLVSQLAAEGLIQPLDTSRLKNWGNLYPAFSGADFLKYRGQVYGAPAVWGPEGLIYRTDKLRGVDSWETLWDPANRGKLSVIDYDYEMVLTAALYLGMRSQLASNPITFSPADMQKIKSALQQQVKLDTKLWADLPTGEALLASGAVNATIGRILFLTDLRKKNIPVALINPKQGTQGWVTSTCISAGTDNLDRAYAFADYTMSAQYGVPLSQGLGYPSASQVSMQKLAPSLRRDMFMNDPNILDKLVFWKAADNPQAWTQMWNEVKASA